jgi:hypothetical protein
MLDQFAMVQKDNFLREPARLAHVMSYGDNLDATAPGIHEQPLDGKGRGRIETRSGFVQKENFRIQA